MAKTSNRFEKVCIRINPRGDEILLTSLSAFNKLLKKMGPARLKVQEAILASIGDYKEKHGAPVFDIEAGMKLQELKEMLGEGTAGRAVQESFGKIQTLSYFLLQRCYEFNRNGLLVDKCNTADVAQG